MAKCKDCGNDFEPLKKECVGDMWYCDDCTVASGYMKQLLLNTILQVEIPEGDNDNGQEHDK